LNDPSRINILEGNMDWLTKPRFSWKETGVFYSRLSGVKEVLSRNIAAFDILAGIQISPVRPTPYRRFFKYIDSMRKC
jgi:hypothetical protein